MFLERLLKGRHEKISIHGSLEGSQGSLVFSTQGVGSALAFSLSHLPIPETIPTQEGDGRKEATVCIALKDLLRLVQCQLLYPDTIVLGVSHEAAFVAYVHWPPAVMTYYRPHRLTGGG